MHGGRIYIGFFSAVNVSALQDLFELTAPADAVVKVHSWHLFQTTELGDSAEEILAIETVRGKGTTSGTGGSTVTPNPNSDGDPAFGGTLEANNTSRQTGGTQDIMEKHGWNVRIPLDHYYPPESQPDISPGDRWALGLPTAPADVITMTGMVVFEEVGG